MGCLFALMAGVFPRLALFMVWVARPKLVDAAFDTWFLPCGSAEYRRHLDHGDPADVCHAILAAEVR